MPCHRHTKPFYTVLAVILAPVFLFAAAVGAQNNNQAVPDAAVKAEATVVGQLQTRNYLITIFAGPSGPLYTVTDADGKVRGVKLSPELLAERFPVLKSMVDHPASDARLYTDFNSAPLPVFNNK